MANPAIEELREEVKQMLTASSLDEQRKARFGMLLPQMRQMQLVRLKAHLLQLQIIEAEQETIDEIVETKKTPKDEGGLLELVLSKVLEKADLVEERTSKAVGD